MQYIRKNMNISGVSAYVIWFIFKPWNRPAGHKNRNIKAAVTSILPTPVIEKDIIIILQGEIARLSQKRGHVEGNMKINTEKNKIGKKY